MMSDVFVMEVRFSLMADLSSMSVRSLPEANVNNLTFSLINTLQPTGVPGLHREGYRNIQFLVCCPITCFG